MKSGREEGFTLIEIIIALVVFSILAAMIVSFSINIPQSASSVITLSRSADLQRGMDNITRAYYNYNSGSKIDHTDLVTFRANLATYITNEIEVGVSVDAGRTKFVTFIYNAGTGYYEENEDTSAPNLKVTLVNGEGQSVSTIFTTR